MPKDGPFDVFLSHNSKDKPAVIELAEVLKARDLAVWLDAWNLVPGRPWQEALEEIIKTTKTAVVLIGKDGLGPWEMPEMRACLSEFVRRQLPVIPVLLPDAPEKPELPLFLTQFTWVDLRGGLTEENLDRLEWGITEKKPEKKTEPPTVCISATRLPAEVVGRDDEVRKVIERLCADPPKRVAVLGTGGVGKSTVLGVAFQRRPEMEGKFKTRRYVVPCDGVPDPLALWGAIATALRLEPEGEVMPRVLDFLAQAPTALAMDNFETPWDKTETEADEVLNALLGVPGLGLAIGMRSARAPHDWSANCMVPVEPMRRADACRVFLNAAGEHFSDDPHLKDFLTQLDGLPLALTLIAERAQGSRSLDDLWKMWQVDGVGVAQIGTVEHKDYVLKKSFDLSINSPRVTDEARRFLSLLALLPDGVAPDDRAAIFPNGNVLEAAENLRAVRLAYEDEARRLRLLAPLREYVSRRYPPVAADLAPLHNHFLELAEASGPEMQKGIADLKRLSVETGNVDAVLHHALASVSWCRAVNAALHWGDFVRFTGLGSATVLETALTTCKEKGAVHKEAKCFKGRGDFALDRSEYGLAEVSFREALLLYRRVEDMLGEASCILRLGDIAMRCANEGAASEYYSEALPLFQRVENVLGKACCMRRLGDIAFKNFEYVEACELYEAALPLYRSVEDLVGEATCIRGLGDVAMRWSNPEKAGAYYNEALPLYQRVGAARGEADCILRLGEVAHKTGETGVAHERYQEALRLYKCIPEPYSIGEAHCRLALVTASTESQAHLCAARRCWLSIKRDDLVEKYLVTQFPNFDPAQCMEAEKGSS